MQPLETVAIIVAITVAVAAISWLLVDRHRSSRLRKRFGPEYERTISEIGDRREAESNLARRERRLDQLRIRPLTATDRERFIGEWKSTQTVFVDDPARAVNDADRLVTNIMNARGDSGANSTERIENISAEYPDVAARYREACDILAGYRTGATSTENLRRAMLNYRELFDELLGERREELRRIS